jgi:hypothetical protein
MACSQYDIPPPGDPLSDEYLSPNFGTFDVADKAPVENWCELCGWMLSANEMMLCAQCARNECCVCHRSGTKGFTRPYDCGRGMRGYCKECYPRVCSECNETVPSGDCRTYQIKGFREHICCACDCRQQ